MPRVGVLVAFLGATGLAALVGAGCGDDCTEQSCTDYGGTDAKTFSVCSISGSGSTDDEFILKDESGEELFTCTRPADNNDACGVELIIAKEAYCQQ